MDTSADDSYHSPPKLALAIIPAELWTDIIDRLDIDTLYALRQTCVALSALVPPRLIEELALNPPLGDLYTLAKKYTPEISFRDRVFRMHQYLDELLKELVEAEPKKWADEAYEWDNYDPSLPTLANHDNFRKETGRKGRGARTRAWTNWNRDLTDTRQSLRRQLARLWAADARFFPFTHVENKEWKRRREERGHDTHPAAPPSRARPPPLQATMEAITVQEHEQYESPYGDDEQTYYENDFSPPPSLDRLRRSPSSRPSRRGKNFVPTPTSVPVTTYPSLPPATDPLLYLLINTYPTVTPAHYFRSTPKTPNQGFPTAHSDALRRFAADQAAKVLVFPTSLTSYQRKELHREAHFLAAGLTTKSVGEGKGRCLIVVKEGVDF
ncbi:hypothetical protein BC936DRAFT_142421 [Jimgerdemannia flammicorona]|uniref:R3H domain-containing protein n=1 Tax=Jimgerdemannia flammicorona TaxID=994334 RepID=A0A433A0P8_9FUNG|nr:hypothetical protein BC936DRAFT_142421 [Jimgerdemannia flammicorona]